MSRTVLLAILVIVLAVADRATAQVFTTPKGEADNVTFKQIGGGTVQIFFDLVSTDPRAVFLVTLDASQDRGNTYTVRPTSVSGDVGPGIKPGTGKLIVWESGRDVERLEIDQFRFRISAQAGQLELKADPASAPAPPAVTSPAPPPTPSPTVAAKKGGGAKWLLIGGGAAAAVGVAAASAGGGGGGPTTTTTRPGTTTAATNQAPVISARSHDFQTVGAVALVLVTDITFEVFATDPDGNSMAAVWTFGDGTTASAQFSNGRAVTVKTYSSGGLFRPSVTVGDGQGGQATTDYQQLTANTVTGLYVGLSASGVAMRINMVQNGVNVSGDFFDSTGAGRSGMIAGVLRAPRTMELTVTYRAGATGTEVFTVIWNADLKSVTAASRSGTTVTLARQAQ